MDEQLRTFGVHVELELLAGRGHQFGPEGNELALQRTLTFFRQRL